MSRTAIFRSARAIACSFSGLTNVSLRGCAALGSNETPSPPTPLPLPDWERGVSEFEGPQHQHQQDGPQEQQARHSPKTPRGEVQGGAARTKVALVAKMFKMVAQRLVLGWGRFRLSLRRWERRRAMLQTFEQRLLQIANFPERFLNRF